MVTKDMAVADGNSVTADDFPVFPGKVEYEHDSDELGGFASIDELEDFLRDFDQGSETEASLATQGEADVGGEPIHTIH